MTAPVDPQADAEIVRLMRANDPSGLELLLRHHGPRILGVLQNRFRSVPESMLQDALHDTALGLMRNPDGIGEVRNLGGWMYVSTYHALLHHIEQDRAQRHPPLPPNAESSIPAPRPSTNGSSRLVDRIRAAIDDLSPLERDILGLDVAHDFSMPGKDIATELGTTPQVVFSTRNRIKSKLQKFVNPPNPPQP